MVLPLIGGILCDKMGVKVALMIFTSLVTIGQLIFTFGGAYNNFTLMLIGRFVFGLGGET
jgi:MFS family permease